MWKNKCNKKGEKERVIKDLYFELSNKKVEINTKPIDSDKKDTYIGIVVGCYTTGEAFLVLDTKELINIKYIERIKILDNE